jgi:hypothetical protein
MRSYKTYSKKKKQPENLMGKKLLPDLSVDGGIVLKLILMK